MCNQQRCLPASSSPGRGSESGPGGRDPVPAEGDGEGDGEEDLRNRRFAPQRSTESSSLRWICV